jgi:hypothetical protein
MAEEDNSTDEIERGFCFNDVSGATGEYLLPSLTPRQIAAIAANEPFDLDEVTELKKRWVGMSEAHYAPIYGVDPDDLAEAGWGVIFAPDVTDAEKEALSPLLKLRKEQADTLYQDFPCQKAYQSDDSKQSFLGRCKAGRGPVDPRKVPYYLFIVGSPESISYRFQYQLDVQYAVGRLHFDTPEGYARYANTVVDAEKANFHRPREVTFFGVRNRADRATQLSADHLIKPLWGHVAQAEPSWNTEKSLLGDQATKTNLASLLGGENTPALLMCASHGMGFLNGDPRQLRHQGAILCQDWPGPLKHSGPIPEEFYFAADHVADQAQLQGLIAFFFACFGGGTPKMNDFAHLAVGPQTVMAPHSFVAALPKRLLGHTQGALAVVGHIERAWSYSFLWDRAGDQLAAFQSTIRALLNGERIGFAMESFNSRYAELSSELSCELEERKHRLPRPERQTLAEDKTLAGLWTANNDARSYVVLGDPAVRLAVKQR